MTDDTNAMRRNGQEIAESLRAFAQQVRQEGDGIAALAENAANTILTSTNATADYLDRCAAYKQQPQLDNAAAGPLLAAMERELRRGPKL